MATMTIDERLAEIRRHIDELEERARNAAAETRARLQQRVEALRQEEELARAAVREKAEAVEDKFWQLEADLEIATNRLDAELASEAKLFADAVDAELRDWEALIERLQTQAAEKTGNAREQAETVIAELRQWRNRAAERLAEVRASSGEAWAEQKTRALAALDELEQKVRNATAKSR